MASLPPHVKATLVSTIFLVVSFQLSLTGDITPCPSEANCGPGTCMPISSDSYECLCPVEYTGSNCDVPIPCDTVDCGAGYCMASGESNYSCVCMSGYTGAKCEEILLPCDLSPCQNNGTCVEMDAEGEAECQMNCSSQGNFICSCLPEYTGQLCAVQLGEYYVQCQHQVFCFFLTIPQALLHVTCSLSYVESCEIDGSAGVEWERTISGISLYQPCQSVDMSLRGADIVRLCSEEGQWNEPDFSQCTVEKGTLPFLLLWVVVVAENREQVDSRRMDMEHQVCASITLSKPMHPLTKVLYTANSKLLRVI